MTFPDISSIIDIMKTQIRREREFHRREEEFLDLARRMIAEGGLAGFNMDRLAEATEYSKGTLYQHFTSKEDLLAALSVQSLGRRAEWFARAVGFAGTTRERMHAITVAEEIFVTLRPLHFRSELMIKVDDIGTRASAERLAELDRLEGQCLAAVRGVVEEAVRVGELTLPPHRTVGDVVIEFVATHLGMYTIMHSFPHMLHKMNITDPLRVARDMDAVYMDGLGWRPLSTESDPAATFRRILQEVFPDEARRASITG